MLDTDTTIAFIQCYGAFFIMKHLITLIQVILWISIDILLFVYYFKWNQFMNKPTWNGFIKQKNGIVRRANNAEKNIVKSKNKYIVAFS